MGNPVVAKRIRFFSADGDDGLTRYHMTIDEPEAHAMVQSGDWREIMYDFAPYIFPSQVVGTVPLYRYRHRFTGDHFFTIDQEEGDTAVEKFDYIPEDVCGYLMWPQQPGTWALYRLLYGNKYHRYLPDADIRAVEMSNGASDEKIAGYIWAQQEVLPLP